MYFRERIAEKLKSLERALLYLESRSDVSLHELIENYELRSAVERNFQIAIEAAVDIGEMIISQEGSSMPETYREVFLRLGDLGIVPSDFADRLSLMAGFRNILVHHYSEIDVVKLHDFLKNRLGDFRTFIRYIRTYLEERS